MHYTMTFHEEDYSRLIEHLFADRSVEQAAYLLCGVSRSDEENRLLVREVIPVTEMTEASPTHMKIPSRSFTRALKKVDQDHGSFVFVHSHPLGFPGFSLQDDAEELKLSRTASNRIKNPGPHGALVLSDPEKPVGRVWLQDGTFSPIERIRVIGRRFRFYFGGSIEDEIPQFYDRQIRAFGKDIQTLLCRLHVGVVGAGGTGSCVAEQLIRLGVGRITVADSDTFDATNVNRVYGTRAIDQDIPKVKLIQRMAAEIGLSTKLRIIPKPITFESAFRPFRECDVIFGCTDDQWGRSLLNMMAYYYLLPVFDMGVKIDSNEGVIRSIEGRVTTLMPSEACLFCRKRIQAETIRHEVEQATNPDLTEERRKQGYAPELRDHDPAVIPFTSGIASSAISEFLHRLTGFMWGWTG